MGRVSPFQSVVLTLVVLLILTVSFFVTREYRVIERLWFNWYVFWQSSDAQALGLDAYEVEIEAQAIDGLKANVSALSFDPQRKTLFTVTNKNPELVELSLEGRILRRIPLTGFGDAEAVEYISPGIYVI